MELQVLLHVLSTVITIGLSGYILVCLAWSALLIASISKSGRPILLKNESSAVVVLGVAYHAVCWPHSIRTVYARHKRRR